MGAVQDLSRLIAISTSRVTDPLHRPFPSVHYWFNVAIWQDTVDIEIGATDHEVDMHAAAVPACLFKIVVAHLVATLQREVKRLAKRDMACGVLVEERVVEKDAGLRNRRAVRHERDFAKPPRSRHLRLGAAEAYRRFLLRLS